MRDKVVIDAKSQHQKMLAARGTNTNSQVSSGQASFKSQK